MEDLSKSGQLREAVDHYRKALDSVINLTLNSEKEEKEQKVFELLTARDKVQALQYIDLTTDTFETITFPAIYEEVENLDKQLRKKGNLIAATAKLEEWRIWMKPSEDAWWWYFPKSMDRFDWIWNTLTVVTLSLAASFMLNIYSAFTVGSASIASIFSIIAQAVGIAALGGGALSEKGKKTIQKILPKIGFPKNLFAEITFILSLILMTILFTANYRLDDYYLRKGNTFYESGQLAKAGESYLKGLKIDPNNNAFNAPLGRVYESLGLLDQAAQYYQSSIENGDYQSLNDLGRVTINRLNPILEKTDPALAESFLLLGLQRAQTHKAGDYLMYQLRTNIGWALLEQKKYERAEDYLIRAIKSDEKLTKELPSRGMAYCFLAQVYEIQEETEKAKPFWQKCIKNAHPQFIHEYKWFTKVKQDRIAYCVNTEDVVAGFEGDRGKVYSEVCNQVYEELASVETD